MSMEEKVKQWLTEEDLVREVKYDENAEFHFVVEFPKDNIMDIVQPKGSDCVIVACATQVSPEHTNLMMASDALTKKDFLSVLNMSLNTFLVDFELQINNDILQQFVVTDQIFEDGLNKHVLISTLKKVFKAKLQCIWMINKTFADVNITTTPSNENDMFI